jgi:hypothetical protein
LHYGNAWPHTAPAIAEIIEDLHFECLPHPPYSPDIGPQSSSRLDHSWWQWGERSSEWMKRYTERCITGFTEDQKKFFFSHKIQALVERWRMCIERRGDYVEK